VLFFATDLFAIATVVQGAGGYIGWIWALYPPALICLAWSSWSPSRDDYGWARHSASPMSSGPIT